jgi:hypothetical protein
MVRLFLVRLQVEAEAKKEDRPKSPGILSKLLAGFKDGKHKAEKKVKAPKSPKKEKKKEEAEVRFIKVSFFFIVTIICQFCRLLPPRSPQKRRPLLRLLKTTLHLPSRRREWSTFIFSEYN